MYIEKNSISTGTGINIDGIELDIYSLTYQHQYKEILDRIRGGNKKKRKLDTTSYYFKRPFLREYKINMILY